MDCSPPASVPGISGENTGVGCHLLLQGIFLTQGLKPRLLHLLHWQADSLPLSHWEAPSIMAGNPKRNFKARKVDVTESSDNSCFLSPTLPTTSLPFIKDTYLTLHNMWHFMGVW